MVTAEEVKASDGRAGESDVLGADKRSRLEKERLCAQCCEEETEIRELSEGNKHILARNIED